MSPALILVDVQKGFTDPSWGERNNPIFENNVSTLLSHWRKIKSKIFHVRHLSRDPKSPLHPGSQGVDFTDYSKPFIGEPIFEKNVNSAFIGTNLEQKLKTEEVESLVIVGLTTDHCVSTTSRMAANLGFHVLIASDATATFPRMGPDNTQYPADLVHAVSLASLHGEFAQVLSTSQILSMPITDQTRRINR